MRKKTHKQYLEELWVKEIIDLPLENYKGSNTPILHECIRGHKTLRRPNNVLMGKKCQKCPIEATYEKYLTTIKNKGLTLVGNYVSMRTPIEHKCPSGHVFFISPDNALRSNTLGCKECSKNSFDKSKPASLYLIQFEVNKSVFYKLGITKYLNPLDRYSKNEKTDLNMSLIWSIRFELGQEARDLERLLNKQHKENKFNTNKLKTGNTETFTSIIEKPAFEKGVI